MLGEACSHTIIQLRGGAVGKTVVVTVAVGSDSNLQWGVERKIQKEECVENLKNAASLFRKNPSRFS